MSSRPKKDRFLGGRLKRQGSLGIAFREVKSEIVGMEFVLFLLMNS